MKGGELEIPPHGTAMTQGFHTFKTPVRIDSFQPHGHARLVGMTAEIFYPDTGRLEMVSSISNWTNAWHTSHVYEDDAAPLLPVGAMLVLTGYYDNTAKNKGNPDPDQWVGGGSRTSDEMSHAWITVTHLDDEGYKQILADREAKAAARTTTTNRRLRSSRRLPAQRRSRRCARKEPLECREALSRFAPCDSRRRHRAQTIVRRRSCGCSRDRQRVRRCRHSFRARSFRCPATATGSRRSSTAGTRTPTARSRFSFGYSNLNKDRVVEIPLGPDNFITPKEYDGRQPTSFR